MIVFVVVVKVRMSCDARTGMTGVAPAVPGGDKPLSLLTYQRWVYKKSPSLERRRNWGLAMCYAVSHGDILTTDKNTLGQILGDLFLVTDNFTIKYYTLKILLDMILSLFMITYRQYLSEGRSPT